MKKLNFFTGVFLLVSLLASAQTNKLKVTPTGIGIGDGVITSGYNINLTNNGNNLNAAYVYNNTAATSGSYSQAITAWQKIGINKDMAVRAVAFSTTALTRARSYGVWATAGNATTGYNYGLYSELMGTNNGTALFAASAQSTNDNIPGKFAAYFNGRVYMSERLGIGYTSPSYTLDVNGNIRCTTITTTSDSRLKTNIADVKSSLGQIGKLRPVMYNLKPNDYSEQQELLSKSAATDTAKVAINGNDGMRKYFAMEEKKDDNRKHIGFIAQEFKVVFPDLVYEDEKGMLSIDYISLIPILVETIQTLNKRVETLESQKNGAVSLQAEDAKNFSFTIFPNPTNGIVTVDYTLYNDAPITIELNNMFGQRVKSILSNQSKNAGTYNVQTSVSDLTTGTYILKVTSGNQVESKQLVVNR